jgi:cell division protein FtsQ
MDGRGRLAKPLNDGRAHAHRRAADLLIGWQRPLRRWLKPLFDLQLPRGVGVAATALFLLASAGYGVVCGDLGPAIVEELTDARDAAANALGFRISSIALAGQNQVMRQEILGAVGVSARSSLLFLDAVAARARLKTNPWIAEATVLKLYPGRLHVAITERDAFALWQRDRKISVIAADGVVLESYASAQFSSLPLVVGIGAEFKAREFLSLVDKYPTLRAQLYASILVAERRWNLKLKNGIDVRLPESGIAHALDTLLELDRDKKLLARDIVAIDLRLPDRVTVRLSEEAAQMREDALREKEKDSNKKIKRKGGDA